MKALLSSTVVLVCTLAVSAQRVTVEGVNVPQDSIVEAGDRIWHGVVTYDLYSDAGSDTCAVTLAISVDSQATWDSVNLVCEGDVGRVVRGAAKKARWTWYGSRPALYQVLPTMQEAYTVTANPHLREPHVFIRVTARDSLSECAHEPLQAPVFTNRGILFSAAMDTIRFAWLKPKEAWVAGYNLYRDSIFCHVHESTAPPVSAIRWVRINSSPTIDTVYQCLYAIPPEIHPAGSVPTLRDVPLCTYAELPGLSRLAFKLAAVDSCGREGSANVSAHLLEAYTPGDTVR
jgi:hypothetical protein